MAFNSSQMIPQLREEFERLLAFVTGPQAQTATMDQMERSLFRQILQLGYQLLCLFVKVRVEGESHARTRPWLMMATRSHNSSASTM
jgi:hypothetical protein